MGQANKKKMECSVVGRQIKRVECGENRISKYDCPADCPHNPWNEANYDRALEINDRFTEKMLSRLRAEQVEKYGYAQSPPFNEDSDEFTALIWFSDKFYREKDSEGRTFMERWEAERFAGLNNDQRIMLEAESKMRAVVLEIQQVIDDRSLLAVDLLDPEGEPFVVVDRSLASSACRFSTLFVMVFDMPHYSRIHSAGCRMPDVIGMGMHEVFMELAAHLGAPLEMPALREWLGTNVRRVVDSLRAVSSACHAAMLRSLDAAYTKSVYDLECTPEKFRGIMEKQKDIEPEEVMSDDADAGFVVEWVCVSEENPLGHGLLLVGSILLHRDGYIQMEASSQTRTEQLKERMEGLFGAMIRFSRERTDDLGAQLFEKRALDYDPDLVPKRLLENTDQIQTSTSRIEIPPGTSSKEEIERHMEQEFLKTFLDGQIPALDGLTPRQAAKDSAVRPKLVELMKSHVRTHDENNLRTGRDTDITGILEELGLDEINFPPPPRREPTDSIEDGDFDDDEDVGSPLLSEEEIAERSRELKKKYKPGYLLECFAIGYPVAKEMLLDMCEVLDLGYAEHDLLKLAARVCFQQMEPEPERVEGFKEEQLHEHLSISLKYVEDGDIEGMIHSLSQPFIAKMVIERLADVLRFGKGDPSFGNCAVFMVSLSESIDEMIFATMSAFFQEYGRE